MKNTIITYLFFICFLAPIFSYSAYVEKVRGKKALIILDGLEAQEGDTFFSIDDAGKRRSILRITKVRNNKAIAEIVKGKASVNQTLMARKSRLREDSESSEEVTKTVSKKSKLAVGAMLGYAMNSMEIKFQPNEEVAYAGETVEQTGTGFSFYGAADYQLYSWFALRGMLGYEKVDVEGTAKDPQTTCFESKCSTDISYFAGVLWGKIYPIKTPIDFWLGAGFGLYFPGSKSSNALDTASIDTTAVYSIGGGADININRELYLPIQLEYTFLPESDDVSTNIYALRLGLMYRF